MANSPTIKIDKNHMDHIVPPANPPPSAPFLPLPTIKWHPYFKKIYLPFLAVLVLAIGLLVGTPLIKRVTHLFIPASATLVDLTFSPSASTLNPGQQFTVSVLIDAKTWQVSAASVSATFASNTLQVTNIAVGPFLDQGYDPATMTRLLTTSIQPGRGTIVIGAACPNIVPTPNPSSTPCLVKSGAGTLATFTMQVLPTAPTGSTQMSFDTANGNTAIAAIGSDTSVLGDANPLTLTIQPPSSPTPVGPTPTPVSQTLQISVRFQGVTTQRPAKTVTVDIKQSTNTIWTGTISMTSDTTGKYTGTTTISAPAGTYDIYVKGPSHLKKRFAGRNITTTANSFDLSSSALLSGDFNNDNTLQIGDVTGIISAWTQSDTPVNSTNRLYDVQENDLISLNDVTAVISNWTSSVVNGDN